MSPVDEGEYPAQHGRVDSDAEDFEDISSEEDSSEDEQCEPVALDPATPIWAQCAHMKASTRVEIKETAMENGELFLQRLKQYISPNQDVFSEFESWLEIIGSLVTKGVKSELLGALFGEIGSGKSTLAGVLLGHEFAELFPTDDERASTAVVTKAVYNTSTDPGERLRGKVERLTYEEWKRFLDSFFSDITLLKSKSPEEERDCDLEDRVQCAMDKLRAVYRHLSEDTIRQSSSSQLLKDANVRDILGKSEEFAFSEVEAFAKRIRSFITAEPSRKPQGRSFCQWPLVKLVTMYVKAEILEHGLALTDLPGNMDSNAARSNIAAEYRKNVKVFCVVAPIHRAADNKSANGFLSEVQERDMKLDGHFNSEHLCYIMTKADDFVNVEGYINRHENVREKLVPETNRRQEYTNIKMSTQSELEKTLTGIKNLIKEMKEVEGQIKNGAAAVPVPSLQTRKRKRSTSSAAETGSSEIPGLRELGEARERLSALKVRLESSKAFKLRHLSVLRMADEGLERIECKRKEVCVQNRNTIATCAVLKQHKASAKDLETSARKLRVFCVSAGKLPEVVMARSTGKRVRGFPNRSSTGIPAVQKWLMNCTLRARESRADEYLAGLAELKRKMKSWADDDNIVLPTSAKELGAMETKFNEGLEEMTQAIASLNYETAATVKTVTAGPIARVLRSHKDSTQPKMLDTVVAWSQRSTSGQPVHWSTYRTTAANGGRYTNNKSTFDWLQDLKGVIVDETIVPMWAPVWHTKLLNLKCKYDEHAKLTIKSKSAALIEALIATAPHMVKPLQFIADSFVYLQNDISTRSRRVFETTQAQSNEIHRLMEPVIVEKMQDPFQYCATQTGNGHYARNKAYMKRHINNHGSELYEAASGKVIANIDAEIDEIPGRLDKEFSEGLEVVRNHFRCMMNRHSISVPNEHIRQRAQAEKPKAQKYIRKEICDIEVSWSQRAEVNMEMQDEQVEYQHYDQGDFAMECDDHYEATMREIIGDGY